MATILAHIQVRPGRESDFETLAASLHATTHETESGVVHYEYWRGAKPALYYCLLAFDDFHAFIAHQTSDHHESASPQLGELIADMTLEWVDPVPGASKLPSTQMQNAAPDADALTAKYSRIFAAKIQDWWLALRSGASA
jgi:quinol monooxygenase YgiN